jgi:hypothetical protein
MGIEKCGGNIHEIKKTGGNDGADSRSDRDVSDFMRQ